MRCILMMACVVLAGCGANNADREKEAHTALDRLSDVWRYADSRDIGGTIYVTAFLPVEWSRTLTLEVGDEWPLPVGLTDICVAFESDYAANSCTVDFVIPLDKGFAISGRHYVTGQMPFNARGLTVVEPGIVMRTRRAFEGRYLTVSYRIWREIKDSVR